MEDKRQSIKIDPTLFVFLGTSPAQVGWRIKKLLDSAYGELPIIRYFWVDTDSKVDTNELEWTKSKCVERAEIGDYNPSNVLQNLENFPHIKNWWLADSKLKPGHLGRGAKQIRSVGRLSLFKMFNDSTKDATGSFYSKLKHSIEELSGAANQQTTAKMKTQDLEFYVNHNRARVFIVFSTCGGTGSGIAFDVAYLCRSIIEANNINGMISGVAILPPVIEKAMRNSDIDQRDKIKANTYAWFKENDFLNNNPSWNVSYPGDELNIENVPFDVNYVIDICNQRGQFLNSEQDTYKMIAQSLFLMASSQAGADYDSMKDNSAICNEFFDNHMRTYCSFASASLIYPKERIKKYCASKLSEEVLEKINLVPKTLSKTQIDSSAIIDHLGLNSQALVSQLLNQRRVRNDNLEFIQSSELPNEAVAKITEEEINDQIEIASLLEEIKQDEAAIKIEKKNLLKTRLLELLKTEGPGYLSYVLDRLVEESSTKAPSSFTGCKKAIDFTGIKHESILAAKAELETNKKELAEMSATFASTAFRFLLPKDWKEKFRKSKTNCISAMETVNNAMLTSAAEQAAKSVYDELLNEVRVIKVVVDNLRDIVSQSAEELKSEAEMLLDSPSSEVNLFELSHEIVDDKYIKNYYADHSEQVDRLNLYTTFVKQQANFSFDSIGYWTKSSISKAIETTAEAIFASDLDKVSLLDAMASCYGEESQAILKKKLDTLVEYCHPFWRFSTDSGLDPMPQGPFLMGVPDIDSPYLPQEYKSHSSIRLSSTGLRDSIMLVRILMGVPSCLLTGVSQWKLWYDKKRRDGIDPLHIFPGAKDADEVLPDKDTKPRNMFAYAMAFGYITKRATHFYFDPEKRYSDIKIRPDGEHKIAAGRSNAEEVFIQHPEWVSKIEELIEVEIQKIGNVKASEFLTAKAKELEDDRFHLDSKSPSRNQLQKEIDALEKLIKELNINQ